MPERAGEVTQETLARIAWTFPSEWLTDDHHYDIAERVVTALLALPVEQRMEAMGMRRVNSDDDNCWGWCSEEMDDSIPLLPANFDGKLRPVWVERRTEDDA